MRLKVEEITKSYGKKDVLKKISFEMENGVYGLLAPNGAGKTTLIRILAGVMNPNGGRILMDGKDTVSCNKEYRSKIGYLPQDLDFYPDFTGKEYLEFAANLKGLENKKASEKIELLVDQVGLTQDINRKCVDYSGGMKRRLGIAQALLNDPEFIILDEPTAGLDPYERIKFRNIISVFSKERTVLLSTHIVSDIDSISKEVIMINEGTISKVASCRKFTGEMSGKVWVANMTPEQLMEFQKTHVISNVAITNEGMEVRILGDKKPFNDATLIEPNMEDAYLYEFNYKGGVVA